MKHVHPTRLRQVRGPQRQPVAAACALLFIAAAAHAQQAPAAPEAAASEAQRKADATIDTVVVTGIRQSLDTSLNLKRQQRGVVDGIVAEDIGKFPDTNLAESMQRISGVSIDRSMGEGSKVTVRGVGPDFNLVLLNGRQMPASTLADTGPSNSRAFDFANLATESIAALEVYKTSRASAPTGGIGATINIKTARPLDTKKTIASIGVKAVHDGGNSRLPDNIKGDSVTPEVSGIYSTTFGEGMFGVSVSGSYQKRDAGYNSAGVPNGWLPFKGDETGNGAIPLPGAPGSERITNRPGPNDVYSLPQNVNYNMNGIRRERTNGQVTFQFAPTKSLTTTLDYTASQNKVHTRRNDLSAWFSFGPSSSSWTGGPVSGRSTTPS
ncbi:TonB-dependent receptor plug domain-containing protein [Roseateles sp. UC29_93]|uniref:TonB-dependent receptor plug domain-containing protein n=1 Tax=Roseateles sp. UC29_93 TaxID=3350177 RepID=UPI0036720012